jgi:hypothetical protein
MVKVGKRDAQIPHVEVHQRGEPPACDAVLDDVNELINSLDCVEPAKASGAEEDSSDSKKIVRKVKVVRSPGVPENPPDEGAVPWLDRFETTNALIQQLEDTLKLMESKGVNLTSAWELANTARSLLDSADVAQALIYANRSFRMALDIHRFPDTGVAAS